MRNKTTLLPKPLARDTISIAWIVSALIILGLFVAIRFWDMVYGSRRADDLVIESGQMSDAIVMEALSPGGDAPSSISDVGMPARPGLEGPPSLGALPGRGATTLFTTEEKGKQPSTVSPDEVTRIGMGHDA